MLIVSLHPEPSKIILFFLDGFHKITSIDNGGLKFDKDEMEFSHPCFQKDHPFLLEHIKRKIANPKQPVPTATEDKAHIKPEAVNKVMNEVKLMRNRQETLDSRFSAMKQENEALWREIAILRQKHAKQQQIVNKLIQFLVTLVQPTRGGGGINTMSGVKRRFQLMINDVPESSKLQKPNEDSVPVIHELTEDLFDHVNYEEGEDDHDEDDDDDDDIDVCNNGEVTSPNVRSPDEIRNTPRDNCRIEDISSPRNFHIEQSTTIVDHPDSDADEEISNNNGHSGDTIDYIISDVMETDHKHEASDIPTDEWLENNVLSPEMIKQEPSEPLIISSVHGNYYENDQHHQNNQLRHKKPKLEQHVTKTSNSKSLLQRKKNTPNLHLNIAKTQKNHPMVRLGSSYGNCSTSAGKIVMGKPDYRNSGKNTMNQNNRASTSGISSNDTSSSSGTSKKLSTKVYRNKNDFISTEIPNELFDSQDGSISPIIGDISSGKYNPTLSEDYSKKLFTSIVENSTNSNLAAGSSTGKNMAITKYNNNKIKNDEVARINSA